MQNFDKRVKWEYYDRFREINDKYLPDRGEGENMATQIVTAINKLVYKWYNDGDVYDNSHYLEGWANDLSSYANWLYKYMPESQLILDKIDRAIDYGDYEFILKDLSDKYLNSEKLLKYEEQEKIGSIYECDGKFKFVYRDEDFEDEDDSDEEMWHIPRRND